MAFKPVDSWFMEHSLGNAKHGKYKYVPTYSYDNNESLVKLEQ